MKTSSRNFNSIFADYFHKFVEYKKALGYDYTVSERMLFQFDAFCCKHFPNVEMLNQDIGLKWAELRENEIGTTQLNRISVIREFARYLNSIGVSAYVIPPKLHMKKKRPQVYIYSDEELSLLFNATDSFVYNKFAPLLHITIPTIFRLIFCCGLRPTEALRLHVEHVNLESGKITILESKGHKDRIVVMADDVLDLMRKYHHEVCLSYNNRKYFFHNTQKGDKYSSNWIIHTFAKVLAKAGFCKQGEKRPRIYDLRHTFATQRLQQWVQEGEDVESCISFLSEYMGHTKLSDTAYYIHLVPNFYSKSVNRGFQVKTTTFPEVSHED